jgi:hypothetical protein
MAALASADTSFQVVPTAGAPAGFQGYTINILGDANGPASAFEANFDGQLRQVSLLGVLATPAMDTAGMLAAGDIPGDSHFLDTAANYSPSVVPPNEDGHPQAVPFIGSHLGASAGIPVTLRADPYALAYVVVPDGGQLILTGSTSGGPGSAGPYPETIVIPEPASLMLLGLGGLGVLIRRRR